MSKKPEKAKRKSKKKAPDPTGIVEIDRLADLSPVTIHDYVTGVSAYVRGAGGLGKGPKKAAQIRLSNALARALEAELVFHLPQLAGRLVTHEQKVAGGLRTANADVSEAHKLDGLRLAVELKPINLAVGRALWNRFGDIRTFAVNIHLKFPFAVVGGVLVIPTYEQEGTPEADEAEELEEAAESGETDADTDVHDDDAETVGAAAEAAAAGETPAPIRKSTVHLIERAIDRLVRAGGRRSEAEADHLLEGIAVIVYDPDTATLHPDLPKTGSGLRWEELVNALVTSYRARFED
jgi:hypothetical protein